MIAKNIIDHAIYRLGAAIVAEIQNSLSVFDTQYFNPLCFLQYYNSAVPFSELNHEEVSEEINMQALTVSVHRLVYILREIMLLLDLLCMQINWIFVHGLHMIRHSLITLAVYSDGHSYLMIMSM